MILIRPSSKIMNSYISLIYRQDQCCKVSLFFVWAWRKLHKLKYYSINNYEFITKS